MMALGWMEGTVLGLQRPNVTIAKEGWMSGLCDVWMVKISLESDTMVKSVEFQFQCKGI